MKIDPGGDDFRRCNEDSNWTLWRNTPGTAISWKRGGHQYPRDSKNRVFKLIHFKGRFYIVFLAPGGTTWQGVGQSGYSEGFYLLVRFMGAWKWKEPQLFLRGTLIAQASSSRAWRKTVTRMVQLAEALC